MVDVTLIFVPPGGGEADYQLPFNLPAVPQPGDYIFIRRKETSQGIGYETFIVRRIRWELDYPDDGQMVHEAGTGPRGSVSVIWVECEFAECGLSTEPHKENVEMYRVRGKKPQEMEESAY